MSHDLEFFDTNLLIAATIHEHIHHHASMARLVKLAATGGACSAHTLAEAYNSLTKFGRGYGRSPTDTLMVLQYVRDTFTLVTLTPRETVSAIEGVVKLGLSGGIVYDALLMACARKIDASSIYTHNVRHFRRVAPDLADRIREP